MKEAAQFAETTQILMNVSEFTDVSRATDTLISSVQAFGYTAETSMDVVDLLNTIGNNYAISTADLAQSLTKSSASLVAAGGDLAEAAALTATANKIIQDADSVGTALKTTSLRLRGTDVSVLEEEGLDSDGAVSSKSKLQEKVKALSGVDILTATGEYKSTYEILRDIADVWENMNDMDQAALLELISGKRNSSVIAAILQNPTELKEAFEDANNAQGSALKENEKYLDSIQGKIDQFNNAVQTLWSNTLDSDVVKFFVDLATQLVKIVDAVGPLNIALVGLVAFLEKNYGVFSNFFAPAENSTEEIKKQLEKAEQDLAKAKEADLRRGTNKTAEKRRNAEERVNILKQKVQEASEEAVLDGIDESFDPNKVKKQISGKKGAITKRAKQLENEGKTFNEIQSDPKIQQYTQDIRESEQALKAHTAAEEANRIATEETGDAREDTTEATWGAVIAEITNKDATGASVLATLKQAAANQLAGNSFVKMGLEAMVASGAITEEAAASAANLPITTLLTAGFTGLAASIKTATLAMWELMTTTPLGPILLLVAGVAAAIAAFSYFHKTTEELQEELSGLKSELSDIRSELESVNSELETANKQMAELLAKDSLTFAEQEELDRLKEITAQLERQKGLLESKEKYQAGRVGRMAARTVDSAKSEKDWYENVPVLRLFTGSTTAEEDVKRRIKNYAGWKEQSDNAAPFLQDIAQQQLDDTSAHIDEYIQTLSEALEGVEYGDSAESDAALDYLSELEDSYAIARGAAGAKTNAIKGLFSKDEFAGESLAIDKYVQALKDGDVNAAESIANIIESNEDLVEDLEARGLEAQDAVEYFTKLGDNLRFDTPEGKAQEVALAKNSMHSLMDGLKSGSIDTNTLFDEEGKVIQTKLSEMFKGTSEKTRSELTKLLEGAYNQIADGLDDDEMESLIQRFGIKMELALLDVKNAALAEQNIELFPGLKEEIKGIIDSFSEMSSALNSVVDAMDLLEQARAEEAYSGSISLETMSKLMEQTDDYSKILSVDEYGAIKLVSNAEDILIDQRIEKIKTDTQAALVTAQKTHEDAKAAEQDALNAKQTLELSGPAQQWYIEVLNVLAGAIAYIGSLWESITSGNFVGMFDRASEAYTQAATTFHDDAAEAEHSKNLAQANAAYEAAVSNRENSEKELKKAQDNANIANKITRDNIKASVDSETASGGNKTKDEVEDDLFQKEMDYWENRIAANQAKYEQLQNEIDLLEKKGQKADASYYQEQIALENERLELLNGQKAAALTRLQEIEAAGGEGNEQWWEAAEILNSIESELDDVTASIVDLQDAIGEIDAYKFEEFNTRLDNLVSKLDTIGDLIAPNGEEDWFSSDGSWTDAGIAVAGRNLQKLELFKQGYQETMDELAKYESPYAGNEDYYASLGIHSEQEWYDKTEELIDRQYNFAESISDTEQSIVDMYESSIDATEEYIETLIDGYNDYIDSVKEALEAERDLYDFKKNVQKQAKDISEIERRIASLSGSTNKADIAERRKLEAQLYESRESLNDTYYDHAKDAQSEALDAEASVYEETMTKMVEGMRASLEEATADMDTFLNNVTIAVSMNADTVLEKYRETNVYLDPALTNPWENAKTKVGEYGDKANNLMDVWKKDGYFSEFKTTASTNLSSPWSAGTEAANSFKSDVVSAMDGVVEKIETNVKTASGELSKLYEQIITTEKKAASVNITGGSGSSGGGSGGSGGGGGSQKSMHHVVSTSKEIILGSQSFIDRNTKSIDGVKYYYDSDKDFYYKISDLKQRKYDGGRTTGWAIPAYTAGYRYYAKGTTGTTRDEWAFTDELGDELVLVPGKDGNLSFMRKGTSVVPANLAENLMEWGQFTPDSLNFGGGVNVNMINNAVIKPQYDFNFDSLVHVDNCSQETLKDLEKMVDNKIDKFSKDLNYSIKRFAR